MLKILCSPNYSFSGRYMAWSHTTLMRLLGRFSRHSTSKNKAKLAFRRSKIAVGHFFDEDILFLLTKFVNFQQATVTEY